MKKYKSLIVFFLLISTLVFTHAMPKSHYTGTGFISKLDLPNSVGEWHGKNITSTLNLDFDKDWNKFISDAIIYQYTNQKGNNLIFIVLDAGNFHNPNTCFTASGHVTEELDTTEFTIQDQTIKTHSLFSTKGSETTLSFYWIIIDKKITHDWIEQKIKQLFYSLFNRKRVGLMVRIDIPAKKENIKEAAALANQFINELISTLRKEPASYLFGTEQ